MSARAKRNVLAKWINATVGSRCRHVKATTLLEDVSTGDVLVHLACSILHVDLLNGAAGGDVVLQSKSRVDWLGNAAVALRAFEERVIVPPCKPAGIRDQKEEDVFALLFQWARCHTSGLMSQGVLGIVQKELLREVQSRLSDLPTFYPLLSGYTAVVEIFDTFSCFLDGRLFLALLYSADPSLFSMQEADALSPSQRRSLAFALAESRFAVSPLLDVDDDERTAEPECFTLYLAALMRGLQASTGGRSSPQTEAALLQARQKIARLEKEALRGDSALVKVIDMQEKELNELNMTQLEMARALEESEREVAALSDMAAKNMSLVDRLSKQVEFFNSDKSLHCIDIDPPAGRVALMFTDVQGSTAQWAADADAMANALMLHNRTIRTCLAEHNGYEVKTEGDAFMVAFQSPRQAVECAVDIQLSLLNADWEDRIVTNEMSAEVRSSDGKLVFRGLRVRVGVHYGVPLRAVDPTTNRMDYFGPTVNEAARIESMCSGGIILASKEVMDGIGDVPSGLTTIDVGSFVLKGVPRPVRLFKVSPPELSRRIYNQPNQETARQSELLEVELSLARRENSKLQQQISSLTEHHGSFLKKLNAIKNHSKLDKSIASLDVSRTPERNDVSKAVLDLQDDFEQLCGETKSLTRDNKELQMKILNLEVVTQNGRYEERDLATLLLHAAALRQLSRQKSKTSTRIERNEAAIIPGLPADLNVPPRTEKERLPNSRSKVLPGRRLSSPPSSGPLPMRRDRRLPKKGMRRAASAPLSPRGLAHGCSELPSPTTSPGVSPRGRIVRSGGGVQDPPLDEDPTSIADVNAILAAVISGWKQPRVPRSHAKARQPDAGSPTAGGPGSPRVPASPVPSVTADSELPILAQAVSPATSPTMAAKSAETRKRRERTKMMFSSWNFDKLKRKSGRRQRSLSDSWTELQFGRSSDVDPIVQDSKKKFKYTGMTELLRLSPYARGVPQTTLDPLELSSTSQQELLALSLRAKSVLSPLLKG